MKKLLLVLFAASLLFSCSKDEEGISSADLVGTWRYTKEWRYEIVDGKRVNEEEFEYDETTGGVDVYNADGTMGDSSTKWELVGDKIVYKDKEEYEMKILKLTASELRILYTGQNIEETWYYEEFTLIKIK